MVAGIRVFESHIGVPVRAAVEYTSVRGTGHVGVKLIVSVVVFATVIVVENRIGFADVTCDVAV